MHRGMRRRRLWRRKTTCMKTKSSIDPRGERPPGAAGRPFTILVADDDPDTLSLIERHLKREAYEVVTARDGREALEAALGSSPDVMILDVMMPGLDGLEVCRILKESPTMRDIPVIFLSALDETDVKISGLSLGANDYVSKPYKTEELIARVGVALRLKHERDRLRLTVEEAQRRARAAQEMSMTDALTNLLNRYGLQRALTRERAEARRYARPLSCLMIDVDDFKAINDTHGHAAGDAALIEIGRILTEAIRGSDVVCRYGGDEFTVLMPETNLEGAVALAEKIRDAASAQLFGDSERNFKLTVSIGAAELGETESGNDMLARADEALYRAKESGRNRVEAAS
jgi:two-component system, cell cycle response regulator